MTYTLDFVTETIRFVVVVFVVFYKMECLLLLSQGLSMSTG